MNRENRMTIRTMVIVAGLAALAGGCTVTPRHYEDRGYQQDHHVYRENDSYEGYYYVRVVYINGDPWYVDDYRRARPIPRHLHAHFRNSSWTRSLPPRFSQDTVVRDGYPLSRIVYINDVPHHVDNDRRARPVSSKLRSRFTYGAVVPGNDRGRGVAERDEQPAFGRGREREEQPAFGRGREREEQPAFGRGREREEQPAVGRGREREEQPAFGRERERRGPQQESMPRPAVAQERVREERGPQDPSFARDVRRAPADPVEQRSAERGAGGDERRAMPNDNRRNGNDGQRAGGGRVASPAGNEERSRVQSAGRPAQAAGDDRQRRTGVAGGEQQRAGSASGKQKEKGKGRGRDRDEEAEDGYGEGASTYRGE
jgi:hypothetical protein